MKKLLTIALLLIAGLSTKGQTGALKIANHTDFDISVVAYAMSSSACHPGTCSTTYATSAINVPYFSEWGLYTPCSIASSPGWNVLETSCSAPTWCGGLPSDFQWSRVEITIAGTGVWPSVSSIVLSDVQCGGTTTFGPFLETGGTWYLRAEWNGSGGALANVTIHVGQTLSSTGYPCQGIWPVSCPY